MGLQELTTQDEYTLSCPRLKIFSFTPFSFFHVWWLLNKFFEFLHFFIFSLLIKLCWLLFYPQCVDLRANLQSPGKLLGKDNN